MASENKTKPTEVEAVDYIMSLDNVARREDGLKLIEIMSEVTGEKPVMWGTSMIGFGSYHYKYASGHEGDALKVGFSPRKSALVLYGLVMYDKIATNEKLLEKLGAHTRGKGCLYVQSLRGIDLKVLRRMVDNAFAQGDYDTSITISRL